MDLGYDDRDWINLAEKGDKATYHLLSLTDDVTQECSGSNELRAHQLKKMTDKLEVVSDPREENCVISGKRKRNEINYRRNPTNATEDVTDEDSGDKRDVTPTNISGSQLAAGADIFQHSLLEEEGEGLGMG
ncbi:hypothetical protein ANN_13919 [Periplaneta americana]|uniref:Uncharacterized protein n=1 Tax=Periplaneta americana TaxID=6978 RepID=A0ABQ8SUV6_PERAM|nr:hypothetical protein ANN_13919 [Periplaneta americana]